MSNTEPTATPPRPGRSVAWYAWRVLRVLLISYLAVVVLMMLFENKLIFFPAPYPRATGSRAGSRMRKPTFRRPTARGSTAGTRRRSSPAR